MSMYRAPEHFVERLEEEFGGRLRIRFSAQQKKFVIEQKVRRGIVEAPPIDPLKGKYDYDSDGWIQARDGVMQVMEFQPGTRMGCEKCGTELKVPVRQYEMISCPMCKAKGYEHRIVAGFWPLDETLVDYLKSIDPLRGHSEKLGRQVEERNRKNQQRLRDEAVAKVDARWEQDFSRIVGIPSVGYTGKVFGE